MDRETLYPVGGNHNRFVRWTGELRSVKAGEWFLSGAIIEGYRASADTAEERHIAKLVGGKVWSPPLVLFVKDETLRTPFHANEIRKLAQAYIEGLEAGVCTPRKKT